MTVATAPVRESKTARNARFQALYTAAQEAGEKAGAAVVPQPMFVVERLRPFDDNSRVVKEYEPVLDGVCGFGWVRVTPGGSAFARWLKDKKGWRSAYGGGVSLSVRQYNQSLTRKEAYATSFAAVLREAGIQAYGESRID